MTSQNNVTSTYDQIYLVKFDYTFKINIPHFLCHFFKPAWWETVTLTYGSSQHYFSMLFLKNLMQENTGKTSVKKINWNCLLIAVKKRHWRKMKFFRFWRTILGNCVCFYNKLIILTHNKLNKNIITRSNQRLCWPRSKCWR